MAVAVAPQRAGFATGGCDRVRPVSRVLAVSVASGVKVTGQDLGGPAAAARGAGRRHAQALSGESDPTRPSSGPRLLAPTRPRMRSVQQVATGTDVAIRTIPTGILIVVEKASSSGNAASSFVTI